MAIRRERKRRHIAGGASCQLETSGKTIDGNRYRYCYYSCRAYCRTGKEACPGVRVATEVLDDAVLAYLADLMCTPRRVDELRKRVESTEIAIDDLAAMWRALLTADHDVGRAYVVHLIDRVELYDDRATVVPRTPTAEV